MYGQYTQFEFQIFIAIVSVYSTRWYLSEFQIFIDIVSISFISLKIYQILVQLQLKPLSSNWKLNKMWCMDNIQSTFTDTLWIFSPSCTNTIWISNFHCNCICIFNSMISIRYYCRSNSNHLVQIENWTRCDVWTIFSPRCSNTLWISNFHCNCVYIFNSMKIHQILLQLQLNLFSSIGKLHLLWCMDNIHSIFYNTFWISNFHWYCIYIIHFNEDLSDISAAPNQSF